MSQSINQNHFLKNNKHGFSLIEILVSALIIMVLMLGIYSLITLSLKITSDNKMYVEAIEIANQKIEQIRNLPYDDVGTVTGSPNGPIPTFETVIREGTFEVHTTVKYDDDPYDGTALANTDLIWDDYKIATVEVSWDSKYGPENITVFSKIIPRTEETDSGNGLLKLIIVDANGNPVPDADIHIENNILTTPILEDLKSDANGLLSYSVPPSFEAYEVTVTKPGYGTDKTYDRDAVNLNPSKPHLSVVQGAKTEESFSIDLLSALSLYTIDSDLPNNWAISTDISGANQLNSRIAIDPAGSIYIVWEDYRQTGSGKGEVFAQKYNSDGDSQWPSSAAPDDIRIDTSNNTLIPDILIDTNGYLFATWFDDSVGNKEIYRAKLDPDDGDDDTNWGVASKLNTLADPKNQSSPRIALTDNGIIATATIVWEDDRNQEDATSDIDLYLQTFDDFGANYLATEIRVNTNPLLDDTDQYEPVIVSDNLGYVFIAWTDGRNGNLDIYGAKYDTEGNLSWENKLNSDAGALNQYQPDIIRDSLNYIYVFWTDARDGNLNIYAQKFDTNGTAQWPNDVLVNSDTSNSGQYSPSAAIDSNDDIYIVWTDDRNNNEDIFAQKIDSDGNSLWGSDVRISINNDESAQYNPDITINPTNNVPFATWEDDSNGDIDIYATSFDKYSTTTAMASVPLTVTGSKKIGENPIIYEYDISTTTDINGLKDLVVEWDATGYTIEVPTSSVYVLYLTEPSQPVKVSPNKIVDVYLFTE